MDNHIEVIGIDHGWSNMKTVSKVFSAGIKEITTEPAFFEDVLEYDGVYYKIGGKRMEVKDTKVDDENYYLLTLASVAKELERRGMRSANVLLSVGLPLTQFGAEKQAFIDYLSRSKDVTFRYDKNKYSIHISRVSVYPQCYAAVVDRIRTLPERVVIVDIGSWTLDIMPIKKYSPDESECVTIHKIGLIKCMRAINEQCVRQLGKEMDESDIQEYMERGISSLPKKYVEIMEVELKKFAQQVYSTLVEHGYNLETTAIVFVGGGARVMKVFGEQKGTNIQYIEDVKANAKGYEYLGKLYLAGNRKKEKVG